MKCFLNDNYFLQNKLFQNKKYFRARLFSKDHRRNIFPIKVHTIFDIIININMSILLEKKQQEQQFKKRLHFLKKHYRFGKKKRQFVQYFCFCEKKYCSFAALYLHAKLKHSYRFKSTLDPQTCQIIVKEDKTKIKFLSPASLDDQDRSLENSHKHQIDNFLNRNLQNTVPNKEYNGQTDISSILELFKNEYRKNIGWKEESVLQIVICKFKHFLVSQIEEIYHNKGQSIKIDQILLSKIQGSYLPTYFNKFIIQDIVEGKQIQGIQIVRICQILSALGKWMLVNSKTEIKVQFDENFCKILKS